MRKMYQTKPSFVWAGQWSHPNPDDPKSLEPDDLGVMYLGKTDEGVHYGRIDGQDVYDGDFVVGTELHRRTVMNSKSFFQQFEEVSPAKKTK